MATDGEGQGLQRARRREGACRPGCTIATASSRTGKALVMAAMVHRSRGLRGGAVHPAGARGPAGGASLARPRKTSCTRPRRIRRSSGSMAEHDMAEPPQRCSAVRTEFLRPTAGEEGDIAVEHLALGQLRGRVEIAGEINE